MKGTFLSQRGSKILSKKVKPNRAQTNTGNVRKIHPYQTFQPDWNKNCKDQNRTCKKTLVNSKLTMNDI